MNESIKNKEFNETSAMVMCIGIKSSVEQVNADVDEFNALLESLQDTDIDIIKFGSQNNMLNKDGIHL
ncbi:unnamed protein product, partial [Rotaria sp. Silwood1]